MDDLRNLFKPTDILAVSFPKSGNTWVRMMYANIMRELYNLEEITFRNLNPLLPEFAVGHRESQEQLRTQPWPYTVPRLVKTHEPYTEVFDHLRCIYIVRNPKDVMISYYYYEKGKKKPYSGNLTDFIRDPRLGIAAWIRHTETWLMNRNRLSRVEIFRYEDMRESPVRHVKTMLDLMGARLSDGQIGLVIERSSFENARRLEEKYGRQRQAEFQESFRFTRDGSVNQWMREMTDEQIRYIDEMVAASPLISEFLAGAG